MKLPEFSQGGERLDVFQHREQLDVITVYHDRAQSIQNSLNSTLLTQKEVEEYKLELSRLCPYTGSFVTCSGNGVIPFEDKEGKHVGDTSGESLQVSGIHAGPRIVSIYDEKSDTTRFLVTHAIMAGYSEESPCATRTVYTETYALMDLESSIVVVDDIEIIASSYEASEYEILEKLYNHGKAYKEMIRSTKFLKDKRRVQERKLEGILNDINTDTGLTGAEVCLMGSHAFCPMLDDDGDKAVHTPDISDELIFGECLGIVSIESLLIEERPLRKPKKEVPKFLAGLAVAVDVHPDCANVLGFSEFDISIICVPIKSGSFALELIRNDYRET